MKEGLQFHLYSLVVLALPLVVIYFCWPTEFSLTALQNLIWRQIVGCSFFCFVAIVTLLINFLLILLRLGSQLPELGPDN